MSIVNRLSIPACAAVAILVAAVAHAQAVPDTGPHVMEVESPNPAVLRGFSVPAYQGRIQFGTPIQAPDAKAPNAQSLNERNASIRAVRARMAGTQLYLDLLRLAENRHIMTAENLKKLYVSARPPVRTDPFMREWAPLIENTANAALADGPYRDVFCVEEAPCLLDGPNGTRPVEAGMRMSAWGAGYNEFRFRAAYARFVEKYANELVTWGTSLSRDAVCTGSMQIGNYDFEKAAYVTRMSCGVRTDLPEGGLPNVSTPGYDIEFRTGSDGRLAGILLTWKLPRDEAQALRARMEAEKTHQLHLVMQGAIGFDPVDREAMNHPMLLVRDHYFVLTGDSVSAYFDAALTKLAAEFSLR